MSTGKHFQKRFTECGVAAAASAILLTACATQPPAPVPLQLAPRLLVLAASTGEHQLVDADAAQARALRAGHPARLERMPVLDLGFAQLNNVVIPRALGAATTPPSPTASKERSP